MALQTTDAELIIYKYKASEKNGVKEEFITAAGIELEPEQREEVKSKIFVVPFCEETERQAFVFEKAKLF